MNAAAAAYCTAFWVSTGMIALAIIPCIILTRAEHKVRLANARAAPSQEALAEAIAA